MDVRRKKSNISFFRVALLFVVAVFIIFFVDNASNRQQASQRHVSASLPKEGEKYFAMGDSYSAGGGGDHTPDNPATNTSSYKNSPWKCHRSNLAAQNIIAKKLSLTLTDTTCSGATTDHIFAENQGEMPPQLSQLQPDTKLVTVTIGANDTALMTAITCIQSGDCTENEVMTTLVQSRLQKLSENLHSIYSQVHKLAPNAKIRHAGYPYIISPPSEPTGTCSEWLTESEQRAFHSLLTGTNDAIRQAVSEFATTTRADIQYLDPLATDSPFMQRDGGRLLDGCSTSMKRYMNGPNDGQDGLWHPNLYGQQHYATLYEKSL